MLSNFGAKRKKLKLQEGNVCGDALVQKKLQYISSFFFATYFVFNLFDSFIIIFQGIYSIPYSYKQVPFNFIYKRKALKPSIHINIHICLTIDIYILKVIQKNSQKWDFNIELKHKENQRLLIEMEKECWLKQVIYTK